MKYPPKLKRGGTIGLICPSSSIKTERIPACVRALEGMGYRVKAADNLDADANGYIAGSGEVRAMWLNRMFADPEVDAVFCVRGGDGSAQMMEYVDYELIKRNPKVFVGYSDVTNLLVAIPQNCHFVVFHGPMVSSNMVDGFDCETRASFFHAVNGDGIYRFQNPGGKEIGAVCGGRAAGELTGGNLSVLSAGIGTPYEVDAKGRLLFIEEVGEPLRKIEKWMTHLKNAGKLGECAGILLGQFEGCACGSLAAESVPQYLARSGLFFGLSVPVLFGIESGHGTPMMTLPMGACGVMDADKRELWFQIERKEGKEGRPA